MKIKRKTIKVLNKLRKIKLSIAIFYFLNQIEEKSENIIKKYFYKLNRK